MRGSSQRHTDARDGGSRRSQRGGGGTVHVRPNGGGPVHPSPRTAAPLPSTSPPGPRFTRGREKLFGLGGGARAGRRAACRTPGNRVAPEGGPGHVIGRRARVCDAAGLADARAQQAGSHFWARGFDSRSSRFSHLPVRWFEVDLPGPGRYKEEVLRENGLEEDLRFGETTSAGPNDGRPGRRVDRRGMGPYRTDALRTRGAALLLGERSSP